MKKHVILVLLGIFTSSSLFAGTWIEDSLGFAFEFPRGWSKAVLRNAETARIQFAKSNRDAILQIDIVRRTKEYDLDRFIEETVDTFLKRYPDLKVVREKVLEEDMQGFDESVFLVMHYSEKKTVISNRFLFHKKGGMYYVIQAKTPRIRFQNYARDLDMMMKTFRMEPRIKSRWRNDSLAYLDPVRDEKAIQYISITIRPIETYPSDKEQSISQSDSWLNSVDGFKNPFSAESDIPVSQPNTDSMVSPPSTTNQNQNPKKEESTPESNGPLVAPETDPI
ncbi:hypothetical protein EHQ58_06110 [Leptospira ognonensis]|uniref:DUF4136 domain-containing protein n=1 Tax=Leptospira ognonensis TaxID=2484945 RepID=A0A4R9K4B6_9LEPT|nr:hypothetical protein [Leptospira ognonensis]TGL60070.1 hypothetical protein EHQ58_06110 [Leptospira ognonensis]